MWNAERDDNLLDGGAHFYDTYECADGKWLAVGAIEPQFHAVLVKGLGPAGGCVSGRRWIAAKWPEYSQRVAEVVKTKTRDEWMKVFDGTDACVAPVLSMDEAPKHPHNAERSNFRGGVRRDAAGTRAAFFAYGGSDQRRAGDRGQAVEGRAGKLGDRG